MARKSRKHLNNANANTAPPIRTYTAGAYLRISVEDNSSITNQRFIIEELVDLKSDIQLHKFYIDDGVSSFSGTRPAFDSLIKDLSDGIIDCVITKDAYVKHRLRKSNRFFEIACKELFYHTAVSPQFNTRLRNKPIFTI